MTTSEAGVTSSLTAQQLADAVPGLEHKGALIDVLNVRTKT